MGLEVKKKYPVPHKTRAPHKLPQRTLKREQRKKSARRLITSLLVMSVLAAGTGIAYTWYSGQQKNELANQPAPVHKSRAIIQPHKVASDAPLGVAVQSVTPELKPGENASLTIRTNPEAECTITVKYNNVVASDSGLLPKKADEFGVASWSWTVAAGTPEGVWPAEVLCKNKKHSGMVRADIKVTNKLTSS